MAAMSYRYQEYDSDPEPRTSHQGGRRPPGPLVAAAVMDRPAEGKAPGWLERFARFLAGWFK